MARAFSSDRSNFFKKNSAFKSLAEGRMAVAIEDFLKNNSGMPVDQGLMKGDTRAFQNSSGGWRVEVDKEYAAYQERGMRKDGTHIVKNYTTTGTSAGFFKRSIEKIWTNRMHYIQEARRAVGL